MPQFDFVTFPELIFIFILFAGCFYFYFLRFVLVPYFEMLKFRKKIYKFTTFSTIDVENYKKAIYSKFFK